jgi:PAN domain
MTNKKFVATVLSMGLMVSIGISIAVMENTDMPGSDIASRVLSAGDPSTICEQRCLDNSSCRAWTYVKPGIWGGLNPIAC